jgi:hypothetical protein
MTKNDPFDQMTSEEYHTAERQLANMKVDMFVHFKQTNTYSQLMEAMVDREIADLQSQIAWHSEFLKGGK